MFLYRKVCMLRVQSKVNLGSQMQLRELVPRKSTRIHFLKYTWLIFDFIGNEDIFKSIIKLYIINNSYLNSLIAQVTQL